MGDVVTGKLCVIYLKLGSVYYPVACGKNASITITSEFQELAPRSSGDFKEFEYARKTGKITGTGISKIQTSPDNLYSVFDLVGFQLSSQKVLAKYSATDPDGNVKVFECNTLIEECNIQGEAGLMSNFSYTLQISGPVVMTTTPVANTNPQILVYEYTASGALSSLTLPLTPSGTILVVYVNGISKRVRLAPDGYGAGEVQYDSSTGILLFGTALASSDYVKVIYIDVDHGTSGMELDDGTGLFIDDGTGGPILVG